MTRYHCSIAHSPSVLVWAAITTLFLLAPFDRAAAQDALAGDLFSKITMSETAESSTPDAPAKKSSGRAILGTVSLSSLLASKNVPHKTVDRWVAVTLSDLAPEWNASEDTPSQQIKLSVDVDAKQVSLLLPIVSLNDDASVDGNKLTELLQQVSDSASVHVTATRNSLAFATSIGNDNVTVDSIFGAAERLVSTSRESQTIWESITAAPSVSQSDDAASTVATELTSTQPTPTATPTIQLSGTWSAKTASDRAWAIRFDEDQRFVMVHQQGSKNSVSRGTYKVAAGKLTLSETDGVTLTGTLSRDSEEAFRWSIENADGKSVLTLNLKKQ